MQTTKTKFFRKHKKLITWYKKQIHIETHDEFQKIPKIVQFFVTLNEGYRERTRKVQKCETEKIEKTNLKLCATKNMKFE